MVAWHAMLAVETAVAAQWRVGGRDWTIVIPVGDGITGPADPEPIGAWVGDIVPAAYPREVLAQPGVPAEVARYTATGLTALPPKSELHAFGFRFAVGALLHSEGYYQYEARRLSPLPALAVGMGASPFHTWTVNHGL
jgi:hypothetical protein